MFTRPPPRWGRRRLLIDTCKVPTAVAQGALPIGLRAGRIALSWQTELGPALGALRLHHLVNKVPKERRWLRGAATVAETALFYASKEFWRQGLNRLLNPSVPVTAYEDTVRAILNEAGGFVVNGAAVGDLTRANMMFAGAHDAVGVATPFATSRRMYAPGSI